METGLTFIEFNYQLLQSFDFLKLLERHDCILQIGGDDQWGNIVAGVDLIRRKTGKESFGLTFPLVTRSDGKKMGKTEKGALFIDKELTPVFDFFQYWRNIDDADIAKFFKLFTFLPLEEIDAIIAGDVNKAKERLALEITTIIHGREEAETALAGAKAAFGGGGGDKTALPTTELPKNLIEEGLGIIISFLKQNSAEVKAISAASSTKAGHTTPTKMVKNNNAATIKCL